MKTGKDKYLVIAIVLSVIAGCAMFKDRVPEYAFDLVCNMKVNKFEAYSWKYAGKKYYFDSYTCKEAFKMNPKRFLENKCDSTNNSIQKMP